MKPIIPDSFMRKDDFTAMLSSKLKGMRPVMLRDACPEKGFLYCDNIADIILCLMGMLLCTFPLVIRKISEKWKSNSASKPSTKYITTICIVGETFVGLGILLALGVID